MRLAHWRGRSRFLACRTDVMNPGHVRLAHASPRPHRTAPRLPCSAGLGLPAALLDLCASPARPVPAAQLDAAFFGAALHHGVAALVVHRLAGLPGLPADLAEGIALAHEAQALRADDLQAQLHGVLQALARAGVPAMPFKGPTLALLLFGHAAARSSRDLDVLIHGAHIQPALAVLAGLGYRPDTSLTDRLLRVMERYGGQHIVFHASHVPVEPHWTLAPHTLAFDLDPAGLWARSRSLPLCGMATGMLGGTTIRVLGAADTLLMLVVHGSKEHWPSLKSVADIAAFVAAHPALDWPGVAASAARQGCRRALDVALLLAHLLLWSPLPWAVVDARAVALARQAAHRLRAGLPAPSAPYALCRDYWHGRERLRDRLAYLLRTVFTPRVHHHAMLGLPAQLDWLAWGLKAPWDFLLSPAWRWLQRLRRRDAAQDPVVG